MIRTLSIALFISFSSLAIAADYEQAMRAYEQQNYRQAYSLFSELADSDDAYAQYMLGRLYAFGNGAVQDFIEAHKWFNLAAARGHGHAQQARDHVAENMTRRQVARAQRLAQRWRPGGQHQTGTDSNDSAPDTDDNGLSDTELLAEIQQGLNNLGYNAGVVDGKMGNRTRQAIINYQNDYRLSADGEPSMALLDHVRANQGGAANPQPENETVQTPVEDAWPREIVRDTFRDGNYTRNPRWLVAQGQFEVQRRIGLRTVQEIYSQKNQGGSTEEQVVNLIIGAVLEQATGQSLTRQPEYAEIYLPQRISNAFALEIELSSQRDVGSIEWGVYQGSQRNPGYRLVYTANGRTRGISLLRLSNSGDRVIESSSVPIEMEDGRSHSVRWTRNRDGDMTISIDNNTLINVNDRGFRDPFDGLTLINRGGDYGIRSVLIQGVD